MIFRFFSKKTILFVLSVALVFLFLDEIRNQIYGGKAFQIDDCFSSSQIYLYSYGTKTNYIDKTKQLALYRSELRPHEKELLATLLKNAKIKDKSTLNFMRQLFQFTRIRPSDSTYRLSLSENMENWFLTFNPSGHLPQNICIRTTDEIRLTLLIFSIAQRYEIFMTFEKNEEPPVNRSK